MSANGKEKIIEYLKSNILVTDGAMGTYFASLYDTKEPPEYCNIKDSKKIYDIHRQYIENGAKIIRTNTYACKTFTLNYEIEDVKESIKCACKIAREAAKGHEDIFIAGDIGPITYNHNDMQKQVSDEYVFVLIILAPFSIYCLCISYIFLLSLILQKKVTFLLLCSLL